MKKVILSLSVLLIAAALAYPQSVVFKLGGGLSWLNGSDLNAGLAGETGAVKAASQTMSGGFEKLGDRWLPEQKAAFKKLGIPFYF